MKSSDLTLHNHKGVLLSLQQGATIAALPPVTFLPDAESALIRAHEGRKAERAHPQIHWKGAKVRGSHWPSSPYLTLRLERENYTEEHQDVKHTRLAQWGVALYVFHLSFPIWESSPTEVL